MRLLVLICLCCFTQQEIISQSNPLVRSTTGTSGSSTTITNGNKTYVVEQSIGQQSVIGTFSDDNYILRQGFIQLNILAKIKEPNIPISLQLRVYPNPFEQELTLDFKNTLNTNIEVSVFDLLGRQVFAKSYPSLQQTKVVLDNLSSGEYFLKVVANKKQFIAKAIKK